MVLAQSVVTARKKLGLTQEELADRTKLTVRTIQRIESGETTPRPHTIKALSAVLDLTFEALHSTAVNQPAIASPALATEAMYNRQEAVDFLQILCLSCFSYLVLPLVHFLVPRYLVKQQKTLHPAVLHRARSIIRVQIYWVIALNLLLLLTLAYNVFCSLYLDRSYLVSYLIPFFAMYLVNGVIITIGFVRIKKVSFVNALSSI